MDKSESPPETKCTQCGRTYQQQTSLAQHVRLEHGERSLFVWCRRCPFRSNRKDNLRRHYSKEHPDNLANVGKIPLETEAERVALPRKTMRLKLTRKDLGDSESWAEAKRMLEREQRERLRSRSSSAGGQSKTSQERKKAGSGGRQEAPPATVTLASQANDDSSAPLDLSCPAPAQIS